MFIYRSCYLPMNRELRFALQVIPGIGFRKSFYICAKLGFSFPFFMINLNFFFFVFLTFLLKIFACSMDKAKRILKRIFKTMNALGTWRALRHKDFLPVSGQRTRSNFGTRRREKLIILQEREAKARAEAEAAAQAQKNL